MSAYEYAKRSITIYNVFYTLPPKYKRLKITVLFVTTLFLGGLDSGTPGRFPMVFLFVFHLNICVLLNTGKADGSLVTFCVWHWCVSLSSVN